MQREWRINGKTVNGERYGQIEGMERYNEEILKMKRLRFPW